MSFRYLWLRPGRTPLPGMQRLLSSELHWGWEPVPLAVPRPDQGPFLSKDSRRLPVCLRTVHSSGQRRPPPASQRHHERPHDD
jgi:hypothetical protein